VRDTPLAADLRVLQEKHAGVSIGSYPWFEDLGNGELKRGVALVARSVDEDALHAVKGELESLAK